MTPFLMGPAFVMKMLHGSTQAADAYRSSKVEAIDLSKKARDCGFVTLAYGFSVFFLCIAIAPMTCLGVWLGLPVMTGTLPWYEARDLLWSYYTNTWISFLNCAH